MDDEGRGHSLGQLVKGMVQVQTTCNESRTRFEN